MWGVWKQIWWTACPRLYSAQAPAGTAAWLTALRSATHLPDCCRVGVKEIWNAWDPDCFIAGLSESLYGLVLLGFAISLRLGGVTFPALNIKRQHHTIYIFSFSLAERTREGERVRKRNREKKKKGNRIISVPLGKQPNAVELTPNVLCLWQYRIFDQNCCFDCAKYTDSMKLIFYCILSR